MVVPTNGDAVILLSTCKTLLRDQHDFMQSFGLVKLSLEVAFTKTMREIDEFINCSTGQEKKKTLQHIVTIVKEESNEGDASDAFGSMEASLDEDLLPMEDSPKDDNEQNQDEEEEGIYNDVNQFEMIQDASQSDDDDLSMLNKSEKELASNNPKINAVTGSINSALEHLNDLQGKLEAEVSRHLEMESIRKEQPYVCKICNKVFSHFSKYKRHANFHTGEKPFSCSKCDRKFRLLEYLNKHLINIHAGSNQTMYSCEVCSKSFPTVFKLKRHAMVHSDETPFECEECGQKFKMKEYLSKHLLNMHPETNIAEMENATEEVDDPKKLSDDSVADVILTPADEDTTKRKLPLQCKECSKVFLHISKLRRHENIHSNVKPFKCIECGRTFRLQEYLIKHLKNVHKEISTEDTPETSKDVSKEEYKCNICSRVFINASRLIRHANIHSGEKPFECKICGKHFRLKEYLTHHNLRVHHGDPNQPANATADENGGRHTSQLRAKKKLPTCTICNKKFFRPHLLRAHMTVHTGERPFACTFCSRTFRVKHILAEHLLTHTGEKPHECKVCHRRFRQRGTLNGHMRLHTGEKPFKCEFCPQTFAYQNSLISHKRVYHTFEKPYLCEVCPSSFRTSSGLKRHVRCHTGAKPYECTKCSMRFAASSGLSRHRLVHTDEKPYRCEMCFAGFRQLYNLRGHIKRIHLKEQNTPEATDTN